MTNCSLIFFLCSEFHFLLSTLFPSFRGHISVRPSECNTSVGERGFEFSNSFNLVSICHLFTPHIMYLEMVVYLVYLFKNVPSFSL